VAGTPPGRLAGQRIGQRADLTSPPERDAAAPSAAQLGKT